MGSDLAYLRRSCLITKIVSIVPSITSVESSQMENHADEQLNDVC